MYLSEIFELKINSHILSDGSSEQLWEKSWKVKEKFSLSPW
jgi:hypothetical protein